MAGSADSATVSPDEPGSTFPQTLDDARKILTWCQQAFTSADMARRPHQDRWARYYKLYRSYVVRKRGDWRSKVFIPIAFWVIETITPRLVAQLPRFLALPVAEDDEDPAQLMEELLQWAATNADVYLELVKATKSSLRYGTGILKTSWRHDISQRRVWEPQMAPITAPNQKPVMDPETGQPMLSPDGAPLYESEEVIVGQTQVGMTSTLVPYVSYDGPKAECVDLFNFWVAPEADEIETARYVIHRSYKDMGYIKERVAEGVYQLPPEMDFNSIADVTEEPLVQRLQSVQLGSDSRDPTRRAVELWEFWTDDGRVITIANRKAVLRVAENPFDHGQKPFVRIVDHLVEHEFYGIGEIETIEGLQDVKNALVNSRIDNIKLVMNAMFAVNTSNIQDLRDLEIKPGGVIRLKGDIADAREALMRIDLGNVTPEAFTEVTATQDEIEKVTGVTAYQLGTDSASMNDTATGVNLLQEAGNTRFALKTRLAELMGLKRLARQWGSLLQQFIMEPKVLRILGPRGETLFKTFDPESLAGSFDFDIETSSSTATESVRRNQSLTLLQVLGPLMPQAIPALFEDVLIAFGKKDLDRYLMPQAELGGVMPGMMPGMSPGLPGSPGMGQPPGAAAPPGQPLPLPGMPPQTPSGPQYQAPAPIRPSEQLPFPR